MSKPVRSYTIYDETMMIANVSVTHLLSKKTLLSWNICKQVKMNTPFVIFLMHQYMHVSPAHLNSCTYDIVSAEVDFTKEKMDKVDLDFHVIPVIESFGRFVKYYVNEKEELVIVLVCLHLYQKCFPNSNRFPKAPTVGKEVT